MPGSVSDQSQGPGEGTPYVPSWCFDPPGPRMCACGHHEGYHGDDGHCVRHRWSPGDCACTGFAPSGEGKSL